MSFACVLNHFSHVQLFVTLWTVGCQAPLSMGFSGKNASLGFSFLLQCIFLTQGLKLHLIHLIGLDRQVLYHYGHLGSPHISFSSLKRKKKKEAERCRYCILCVVDTKNMMDDFSQ